jgi:hypothetical protein
VGGRPGWELAGLALSGGVYLGVKLGMSLGWLPGHLGVLHVLTVPILVGLVRLGSAPGVVAWWKGRRWLAWGVGFLAGLTLEIYLVHDYVHGWPALVTLGFPWNVAAFWAVTLPLAWGLGRLMRWGRGLSAKRVDGRAGLAPAR